jgi:hypothetical protein
MSSLLLPIPHMQAKKGQCVNTSKSISCSRPRNNLPTSSASSQKSLAAYHPNGQRKIKSSINNEEHNPRQTECKHEMYDRLDETQTFQVADSFVSFMQTFQYLGLLISYNLRNNNDTTARIAAANASMGALKEVWRNPHLEVYKKYLLFRAIPMNLLL